MGAFLFDEVLIALLKAVNGTLGALWGMLAGTAFTTPDVTGLPQVAVISARALTIVNASFVLAIIAAGVMVMGRESVQSRYGLAELGPRLVIGWIAANFASPICAWMIGFGNSVTEAVTGDKLRPQAEMAQLTAVLSAALTNPGDALLAAVIAVILTVLTGMLLATWIVRIGVLVVVVSVAPVALACHATPFTDGAARLWWRTFTVLLATVTLQALALHVTLTVFLDPKANLPGMMLPKDPTGNGTINLLIIGCLLWVTVRIPALLRRSLGGGRQQNILGIVLRMAVVQKVTGLLRLPLRALGVGRTTRRATSGGARAAAGGASAGPSAQSAVSPSWRPRAPRPVTAPGVRGAAGSNGSARGSGSSARPAPPAAKPPARPRPPLPPPRANPATAMPRQRPAWQVRNRPTLGTPRRDP
ncbi:hypothetical protein ACFPIJ_58210 [Dactylosporangium cerinum]|uniref:Integral membrane protein n=1 Tax=Dactylosporangium cerinum TaxID=1434730 RepID=A0ABV9WJ24_9ACTN